MPILFDTCLLPVEKRAQAIPIRSGSIGRGQRSRMALNQAAHFKQLSDTHPLMRQKERHGVCHAIRIGRDHDQSAIWTRLHAGNHFRFEEPYRFAKHRPADAEATDKIGL